MLFKKDVEKMDEKIIELFAYAKLLTTASLNQP